VHIIISTRKIEGRDMEKRKEKLDDPISAVDPNSTLFTAGLAITPEEQQRVRELLRSLGDDVPTVGRIVVTAKMLRKAVKLASPR
jgi:hypothetical protein